MTQTIPNFLISKLKSDYDGILEILAKKGYLIEPVPQNLEAKKEIGESIAQAYPIQGLLKYHGLADGINKIAFFPSISLNNDCAQTISYLKFDKSYEEDSAVINGKELYKDDLSRIKIAINSIRNLSKIKTKARLISRNFLKDQENSEIGKGLGTSASGSAALALAALDIIYEHDPLYVNNSRLKSIFSRFLSGSGCRSATGGLSLWLSHPKLESMNSFAVRLDRKEHSKFIDQIALLTIPIESEIKTTQAHEIAPKSLFFESWLMNRQKLILEFIDALDSNDLRIIGELAEYDTLCLHSVAMTGGQDNYILAWAPETLKIMHYVREIRKSGYEVYYSIDTGPSVVLLTQRSTVNKIENDIKKLIPEKEIIQGKIGGPSKLLNSNDIEYSKLKKDINQFNI